jgi:hypothetical protein
LYYITGEMEDGTESLELSKRHYLLALDEYRQGIVPFDRAGLRSNLGNVLRLMGQRKKDAALISDALEHHAAAFYDCVRYSPNWAFRAADAVGEDIELLRSALPPPEFEKILAKHEWILALRAKHVGHQIGLNSIFRVAVAGTSGTIKPDFDSVPRKGDRIKDGSVVWENGGKFSYCVQCGEFLSPADKSGSAAG